MSVLDDFHLRFQRLRDSKGLSQDKLSSEAGVSLRYYQDIEQGRKRPSLEKFGEMLEGLKVSPGQFFKDPPSPTDTPDFTSAVAFLSKFGSLKPDLQKMVLAIVHGDVAYAKDVSPDFLKKCEPLLKAL